MQSLKILVTIFFIIWASTLSAQDAQNLQQQLQRLQSAVQQSKQGPANSAPAFMPANANRLNAGGVPPPVTAPTTATAPGLTVDQPSSVVSTTTTTTTNGAALIPGQTGPGPTDQSAENNGGLTSIPSTNMRDQAFTDTTDNLLPLTPDQIRTLHTLFSRTQRAVAEHPGIPPRPTSTSKIVNLSPGATPPIIRLLAGYVTSLVFLDASGAPWPIAAYDLGDPRSYNIQWDKKSNMLLVQAITEYKTGNLAVLLQNLNTPIMLTLIPGQRAVDYRVDLRVPGMGPNAAPTVTPEVLPGASNPILLDVLNGIPPQGSRALQILGRDCQVWIVGGKMYLRTRMTILSPGWISTLSSADGMHAYEMQPTPVLLASENGKMVKLTIQGL